MEKPAPKPVTLQEIKAEIARIEGYLRARKEEDTRIEKLYAGMKSPPKCDKCGTRDAVAGRCGMCEICSR